MQEENAKTLNQALQSRTFELEQARKEIDQLRHRKKDFRQAESQVIRHLKSQLAEQADLIKDKDFALQVGDGKLSQLKQKIAVRIHKFCQVKLKCTKSQRTETSYSLSLCSIFELAKSAQVSFDGLGTRIF